MRFLIKLGIVLLILGVGVAASYDPVLDYWHKRNQPEWTEVEVARGAIVTVVNSTGTVKPVLSVKVGSFVSGPIQDLYVDFNDEVKKGQLLAQIDTRLFESNLKRDEAILETRKAEIDRIRAMLQKARNDEKRAKAMQERSKGFISQSEMDQVEYERMSAEAQLTLAIASAKQAEASLANSQAQLDYTEIRSPVDGIVIDRKIDRGQTLAAQFQTPELFLVAPRMREEIHVYASVDEADLGLIRDAHRRRQPVHFTVDAYPNELFEGKIVEVRYSSTRTENIVTYPAVVSASNPDLKLLPEMTASLSFQIDDKDDVLKIPNSALRFYPLEDYVHPDDRQILDGASFNAYDGFDDQITELTATERMKAALEQSRRHVWVVDGDYLRAIEVITGISDNKYTEVLSGELKERQKLIVGMKPKKRWY